MKNIQNIIQYSNNRSSSSRMTEQNILGNDSYASIICLLQLQKAHKQWQEKLSERKQSLLMHVDMLVGSNIGICQNKENVCEYLKIVEDVNLMFVQKLMNEQINIQDSIEMKYLIRDYQGRIAELRRILIDKENQISFQSQGQGQGWGLSYTHKHTTNTHNLKQFHLSQIEKNQINKHLREYYKLAYDLTILEDVISQNQTIHTQTTQNRYLQKEKINQKELKFQKKNILEENFGGGLNQNQLKLNEKGVTPLIIKNDKLFAKFYGILEQQLQIQRKLLYEYENLKQQIYTEDEKCIVLSKKYNNLVQERVCNLHDEDDIAGNFLEKIKEEMYEASQTLEAGDRHCQKIIEIQEKNERVSKMMIEEKVFNQSLKQSKIFIQHDVNVKNNEEEKLKLIESEVLAEKDKKIITYRGYKKRKTKENDIQ